MSVELPNVSRPDQTPGPMVAVCLAGVSCALAAILYVFCRYLLDLTELDPFYMKLSWSLTPWHACPSIIEGDNSVPWAIRHDVLGSSLFELGTQVLLVGLLLLAAHSATFLVVALLYARFGRPPYFSDITRGAVLWSAWAWSACWACWIPCLAGAAWLVWGKLEDILCPARFPLIVTGNGYLLAHYAAVVLGHAFIAAVVLRRRIVHAVSEEQLRCGACGYLLRSLPEPRCPECGRAVPVERRPAFGLRWCSSTRWRPVKGAVAIGVPLALLLAPLAIPELLLTLPTSFQEQLPTSMQGVVQALRADPEEFPVRFDAVCILRRDGAVAVVRVRHGDWRYESTYWSDENAWFLRPPEITKRGRIDLRSSWSGDVVVGPWTAKFTWGMQTFWWLRRPDPDFEVQVLRDDEFRAVPP